MLGINIINVHGGLGNQMFEYALFLNLRKHHPFRCFLFDIRYSKCVHEGFELQKLFNIRAAWRTKVFSGLCRIFSDKIKQMPVYQEKSPFIYEELVFNQKNGTYYEGCWQSEKYFAGVEGEIRQVFAFNEKMLNKRTLELSRKIKNEGTYASIHIRRGDYIKEGRYLCPVEYYRKAVDMLQEKHLNLHFVVFSDDIEWVRKNMDISNAVYVDWNKAVDSWQDMYLMSICHHNIIANSTFSWWGAWLNNHIDKIVIAPPMWLEEETKNLDIIPNTWRILEK